MDCRVWDISLPSLIMDLKANLQCPANGFSCFDYPYKVRHALSSSLPESTNLLCTYSYYYLVTNYLNISVFLKRMFGKLVPFP